MQFVNANLYLFGISIVMYFVSVFVLCIHSISIGLAYAIGGRVYLHSKWNSRKFGATTKPKTILLLDSKGQVNSFGMDAKLALSLLISCGALKTWTIDQI